MYFSVFIFVSYDGFALQSYVAILASESILLQINPMLAHLMKHKRYAGLFEAKQIIEEKEDKSFAGHHIQFSNLFEFINLVHNFDI